MNYMITTASLLPLFNLILGLVCCIESLFIVKILIDGRFASDDKLRKLNITGLLRSWRWILLAIAVYVLKEAFWILVTAAVITWHYTTYMYDVMGTVFLGMLATGLYRYYVELKWSILIPPVVE